MPEGHTIHRVARDHERHFSGQSLGVFSPQGRFAEEAKRLDGKRLKSVEAHGKHLFYEWPKQVYLHIHLGLYGKFRMHKNPAPEPRGAVRIRMVGQSKTFDLNGPNCCELLDKAGYEKILNRLGEDPLRNEASPERVWERIQKSRSPIGKLLLDQSVIAGVGNVYRAEVLFAVGINPERLGKDLRRDEFDAIWELLVEWLNIGVKYNRIITAPRGEKPRSRLNREERLMCYKKLACTKCGCRIKTWELGARKIYACAECQA